VLLFGALAVATAAADEPTPTAPITPNSPEFEPNDDFDTATYIDWGTQRHGKIDPVGDVDFYRFYVSRGDSIVIDFYKPATSPLVALLSLYDQESNLIKEAVCTNNESCLQFVSNDWEDVYLKVSALDAVGGSSYEYRITLTYLGNHDPNEPNDFPSEATPIAYDEWQWGELKPCGDMDYFTFEGEAGQEIYITSEWWYVTRLLDSDLNLVVQSAHDDGDFQLILPTTGTYYLEMYSDEHCDWSYGLTVYHIRQPIYMSFNKAGVIQDIAFTAGDVLRYWTDTGEFELFIDMSDLGLKGNLTALGYGVDDGCWWSCDYTFLFGFAAKYTYFDLGTVQPQDLVAFLPESVGWDTAGWIDFAFDGSDVGLTTTDETLDAVGMPDWFYGELFVSTTGRAKVPYNLASLVTADEDVARFSSDWYLGQNTSGVWWPFFDGSAYRLGDLDVIGADYGSDYNRQGSVLWLSFNAAKTIDGVAYAPGDIAECFDSWNDEDEQCDSFAKFFDASDAGIAGVKIDAFEVGMKE
jgi:hypothetical protein